MSLYFYFNGLDTLLSINSVDPLFVYYYSLRCNECNAKFRFNESLQKSNRPPYSTLQKEISETSYVAVGKKYNVSDNCIREWMKKYEKNNNLK